MGCDGGTIPKRDELVKTKKKGEKKDCTSERLYRWRHCALSQALLRQPVVACELGRLYNKDEIITCLLNKTQESNNIEHIRGLKDVHELVLTPNPAYEGEAQHEAGNLLEDVRAQWICPVSGLEMNGKHGFCFSWNCGCVVSRRAMREVPAPQCSQCGAAVQPDAVVTLNPDPEQLPVAEARMIERRRRAKEDKKQKRDAKRENEDGGKEEKKTGKKQKLVKDAVAGSSKTSTSISGLASSILRGTEFSGVRSKEFSVANNPQHSEVYKSIFDTHKSANKKLKSNWVTCNPQYY